MTPQFPLAGLLRIRKIQQDQAASNLARATSRSRSVRVREAAARNQLIESADSVSSTASLRAVAASRAAAQGMLADLQALAEMADAEAAAAQASFTEARTRSVSLEKLEARHLAERLAAELGAEQGTLDEIASMSWHRDAAHGHVEQQGGAGPRGARKPEAGEARR